MEAFKIENSFLEAYKRILLLGAKRYFGDHIEFNPDKRIVDAVIRGQINNIMRYGHAYCPCRIEKIRKHICPCEPAKEELEKEGICHCKLFINPRIYNGEKK